MTLHLTFPKAILRRRVKFFSGPPRLLVGSFAGLILSGTFLLMLPQSTVTSRLGFIDALFTATSATCVTGLVVVDTGTAFTHFGQLVILGMIQLGGLGIMTFSTFFLYLLGGRISLGSRELLQETISQGPFQNLKSLLKTVVLTTIIVEAAGAFILTARFLFDMPLNRAIYHGIFHSISAFCNAGFSLCSDSFILYKSDPVINFTLALLIILGGLGFIVIFELRRFQKNRSYGLSLHSRLVLLTTAFLILSGAFLFLLLESKNAVENLPWDTKILTSFFQSITARTAGFNTLDIGSLTNPTLFILIMFMFIGASPGSCGGGIKTTTFAILVSLFKNRFYNQDDVSLMNRRIPSAVISKVISVTFFSIILIALFTILLLISELAGLSHQDSRGMFLELLFEVTSAFGTVGLSTGLTPDLSAEGRLIITLMMFIGRLSPLTIAMAVGNMKKKRFKYAQENIMIG